MKVTNPDYNPFRYNKKLLLVSIILIASSVIIAWLSLLQIKKSMQVQLSSSLQTTLETTKERLDLWINEHTQAAQALANNTEVWHEVESLISAYRSPASLINHPSQAKIRSILSGFMASDEHEGFFIIAPDFINLASMRDANTGVRNLLTKQKEFLESIFSGHSGVSLPQLSDVPLADRNGEKNHSAPTMFAASPIYNGAGKVMAVVALRINPTKNYSRIAQLGRAGQSGETYFFNNDGVLLSDSRFDDQLQEIGMIQTGDYAMLSVSIRNPGGNMLEGFRISPSDHNKQPLTFMASSAIAGESEQNLKGYNDYRGVPVIGAWLWDDKGGFGITTEMDMLEAYKPYEQMKQLVFIILATMFLLFISLYLWTIYVARTNEKKLEEMNRQLEALSFQDGLTSIANRRLFDEVMTREWGRAQREGKPISLIMIDIDFFKQYNDFYGHQQGDYCLKEVAQILLLTLKRSIDLVARYGGEEFVVLLPGTSGEQAFLLAEECRRKVLEHQLPHEKSEVDALLTISLGVSTSRPDKHKHARSLIEAADQALYRAKENGRNQVKGL